MTKVRKINECYSSRELDLRHRQSNKEQYKTKTSKPNNFDQMLAISIAELNEGSNSECQIKHS